MGLNKKTLKCSHFNDLPSDEVLNSISRDDRLFIIFKGELKSSKENIGEKWKNDFPDFFVNIHKSENMLSIMKLITVEEIEQNQLFLEKCAKDYGILGEQLLRRFAEKFEVEFNEDLPLKTLNPYGLSTYEQGGEMDDWKYFFHGYHCAFTNQKTGQHIEVPLTFGLEFGQLDPYFFSKFIKSTPEYKPVPIKIQQDFHDGCRILDTMFRIGKFEEVNSNDKERKGIIVKNRIKRKVKIYEGGIREILSDIYRMDF